LHRDNGISTHIFGLDMADGRLGQQRQSWQILLFLALGRKREQKERNMMQGKV
jgi:hypothetical protein